MITGAQVAAGAAAKEGAADGAGGGSHGRAGAGLLARLEGLIGAEVGVLGQRHTDVDVMLRGFLPDRLQVVIRVEDGAFRAAEREDEDDQRPDDAVSKHAECPF